VYMSFNKAGVSAKEEDFVHVGSSQTLHGSYMVVIRCPRLYCLAIIK